MLFQHRKDGAEYSTVQARNENEKNHFSVYYCHIKAEPEPGIVIAAEHFCGCLQKSATLTHKTYKQLSHFTTTIESVHDGNMVEPNQN